MMEKMKQLLKKFPGLVKPYDPNPAVPWLQRDLSATSAGLRFAEPDVQAEFVVFQHRDMIMIMISAVYLIGQIGFAPTGLVVLEGFEYVNNAAALVMSPVFLADIYFYLLAEMGPKVAAKRRIAQIVMCLPIAACCCLTPFVAYQVHNCIQAVDLTDILHIRRTPQFSEQEQSWYCSGTVDPFSISALTIGFFALPLPPFILFPLYLMCWMMLISMRFIYPNHDSEPAAEMWTKILITLVVSVAMMLVNGLRYTAAMSQFKLAIKVKKETLLSERQEEDVDTLLCSMLPGTALERLGRGQHVADYTDEATVLFSDMVSFTAWSSTRSAESVVSMLNALCRDIDNVCFEKGIEKIKTIGDAYWAVSGLPGQCESHAETMCDFGNDMLDVVEKQNKKHPEWNNISLRIGVHSGPLHGGILGTQQLSYEVWGDTNSLANVAEQRGVPGRVVASQVTLDALGLAPEALGAPTSTIPCSTLPNERGSFDLFTLKRTSIREMLLDWAATLMSDEGIGGGQSSSRRSSKLVAPAGGRTTSPSTRSKAGSHQSSSMLQSPSPRSTHSSASAYSQTDLIISEEEAKKNRAKLLQQRVAARSELGIEEEPEEAMEVLVARYSERRWKWLLMDFAEEEVEGEYFEFVKDVQLTLRLWTRVLILLVLTSVVLGVMIQGGAFPTTSTVCFSLAAVSGLCDLALCRLQQPRTAGDKEKHATELTTIGEQLYIQRWKGQAVLCTITSILIIHGAGRMGGGQSAGTNDITYLHQILSCLIAVGNVGLVSSAALVGSNLGILVPLMLVETYQVVYFATHVVFLGMSNLAVLFTLIIMEKQYRNAFLEQHVALYMHARQVQRGKEREALLASMVPSHIVQELMVWMVTMNPAKSIVHTFPTVCVGFIQTYRPAIARIDLDNHERESGGSCSGDPNYILSGEGEEICENLKGATPTNTLLCYPTTSSPIQKEGMPISQGTDAACSGGSADGAKTTRKKRNTLFKERPSEILLNDDELDTDVEQTVETPVNHVAAPVALRAEHWLQVVHNQVDELLKSFVAVSKIKSIGDYVMLAGPFDVDGRPQSSIAEACDDMLAAAHLINAIAPCRVGLHVGEIVGAVLGTNRLCYDIFGDTVNTASRTMSSGEKGDFSVSEDFFNAHPTNQSNPPDRKQDECPVREKQDEDHEKSEDKSVKVIAATSLERESREYGGHGMNQQKEENDGGESELMAAPVVIPIPGVPETEITTDTSAAQLEQRRSVEPNTLHSSTIATTGTHTTKTHCTERSKPWQTSKAVFSSVPKEVHAKGKGTILIRRVLSVPAGVPGALVKESCA